MKIGDSWPGSPHHATPHLVYRCFDAEGQLLYVGCTIDVDARMSKHKYSSPWGKAVSSVTVETYRNRRLGLAAERVAIEDEAPIHNVQYNVRADERGPWAMVESAETRRELAKARAS